MGRHHARVLRALDGVELVAVADPGGDPHGVAGGLPVLPDVEELIAAGIDMAVVAVPTRYHEEVGLALAEAGVHTLVEKPIAATDRGRPPAGRGVRVAPAWSAPSGTSSGSTRRCRSCGAARGGRARRGLPDRHPPPGPVPGAHRRRRRRQGPRHARHRPDRLGGPERLRPVSAQTASQQRPRARGHGRRSPAASRTASIANHLVNWLSPDEGARHHRHRRAGAPSSPTRRPPTSRSTPTARSPIEWESVATFRGVTEGDVIRYALAKREPLRVEHEAFRDAVLGGRSDVVTMRQGLRTLEVAEAALESASNGASVTF